MNLFTRTIRRIKNALTSAGSRMLPGMLTYMLPVLILTFIFSTDTAYAADVIAEDSFQTFLQKWGQFIAMIGSLINVVLWIVISFISDLLNNDFIFGADMEVMLLSIWQTVRNFVNIAFVFVLLVIAFYNVVSIDTEKIPLRKSLGKLAIALVLVNFSYFGARVVLDVANVLTTAVFAIPRDIITGTDLATSDSEVLEMCHKRVYLDEDGGPDESSFSDGGDAELFEEEGTGRPYVVVPLNCHIPNLVKIQLFQQEGEGEGDEVVATEYDNMKVLLIHRDSDGNEINISEQEKRALKGLDVASVVNEKLKDARLDQEDFGRNTITMVLAKTLFDINKLTEVTSAASKGFTALTISGIVNLLLLLLYGAMFIAMFIVLIFRVVYLWVCIAFSPIVALMFVFKDFGIEMGELDLQKLFIQYAFVPVKMGIALSAGTLMLFKANQITAKGKTASISEAGEVTFDIPLGQIVNNSSIQSLMWQIATVAVVWMAVKWSMKDLSGPVSGITDRIFGYVGTLGELASKVPLTLPIIPYYNDEEGKQRGGQTVGKLLYGLSGTSLRSKLQGAIYGTGGADTDELTRINQRLGNIDDAALQRGDGPAREELRKLLQDKNDMANIYNTSNANTRLALAEKMQAVGLVSPERVAEYSKSGTPGAFGQLIREARKHNPDEFNKYFGTDDVEGLIAKYGKGAVNTTPVAGTLSAVRTDMNNNKGDWVESEQNDALITQIFGEDGNSGLITDWNDDMKKAFKIERGGDNRHSLELTKKMVDDVNIQMQKVRAGEVDSVAKASADIESAQGKELLKKSGVTPPAQTADTGGGGDTG